MDIKKRNSIHDNLCVYDYLAEKNAFIEVTEWANGEGWDITINDKYFSLTEGQLNAINYLTKSLDYDQRR
jgi:hypothetical protein